MISPCVLSPPTVSTNGNCFNWSRGAIPRVLLSHLLWERPGQRALASDLGASRPEQAWRAATPPSGAPGGGGYCGFSGRLHTFRIPAWLGPASPPSPTSWRPARPRRSAPAAGERGAPAEAAAAKAAPKLLDAGGAVSEGRAGGRSVPKAPQRPPHRQGGGARAGRGGSASPAPARPAGRTSGLSAVPASAPAGLRGGSPALGPPGAYLAARVCWGPVAPRRRRLAGALGPLSGTPGLLGGLPGAGGRGRAVLRRQRPRGPQSAAGPGRAQRRRLGSRAERRPGRRRHRAAARPPPRDRFRGEGSLRLTRRGP